MIAVFEDPTSPCSTANRELSSIRAKSDDDKRLTDEQNEFDCLTCGRCCYQREGTILVTEADLLKWHRARRFDIIDAIGPGHFGQEAFQMSAKGACIHHGTAEGEHVCAIYSIRAEVCRSFQAGSQQCLEYRRALRR